MYDAGSARAANDALWRAWSRRLREAGINVPEGLGLERVRSPEETWRHPDTLIAQACSLPWVLFLQESSRIFAIPRYRVPGCEGLGYRSVLVVRVGSEREDLEGYGGSVVAVNGTNSHSGHTVWSMELARQSLPMPFFATARISGSHAESLRMVAEGNADIAAIDCVALAHLRADGNPYLPRVRAIGETPSAPALPLITSATRDASVDSILFQTLFDVIGDAECSAACEALFLGVPGRPDDVECGEFERIRRAWRLASKAGIATEWQHPEPRSAACADPPA